MSVYNKRFFLKMSDDKVPVLDKISFFFRKTLYEYEYPIRFAVVDVQKGKLVIDATILDERELVK